MPSRIFAPNLLDGQVAVVTGGGSGLGRATALDTGAKRVTVQRRDGSSETVEYDYLVLATGDLRWTSVMLFLRKPTRAQRALGKARRAVASLRR